jgi:hypothetical protein
MSIVSILSILSDPVYHLALVTLQRWAHVKTAMPRGCVSWVQKYVLEGDDCTYCMIVWLYPIAIG